MDLNGWNCIGIELPRKVDWFYCIVIVLQKLPLLIIVLELYWSQKACIGQPWNVCAADGHCRQNVVANIN